MKISKLALIALLGGVLMSFGCGDDGSTSGTTGGSGGTAGAGGAGGSGGSGGSGDVTPPTCESTACIFCPSEALGGTVGAVFPDGLNVPIDFTAIPVQELVQGATSTIDLAAESVITGLPVAVDATVDAGSTMTYAATAGGTGTTDIPVPEQALMGTDLIIDAGEGSGDFTPDVVAEDLLVQITSALFNLSVVSLGNLPLILDATETGGCVMTGDGVTLPVTGAGGAAQ